MSTSVMPTLAATSVQTSMARTSATVAVVTSRVAPMGKHVKVLVDFVVLGDVANEPGTRSRVTDKCVTEYL